MLDEVTLRLNESKKISGFAISFNKSVVEQIDPDLVAVAEKNFSHWNLKIELTISRKGETKKLIFEENENGKIDVLYFEKFLVSLISYKKDANGCANEITLQLSKSLNEKLKKFSGKITNIDLSCIIDGPTCSITVNNKKIIFAESNMICNLEEYIEPIWGKLIGFERLFTGEKKELFYGKKAEAYVIENSDQECTLKGNKKAYLKLIE